MMCLDIDERKFDCAEFGRKFRDWRVSQDLTQSEVALQLQLAGLSCDRHRIARIESGQARMSIFEFAVLHVSFGLSYEYIMD